MNVRESYARLLVEHALPVEPGQELHIRGAHVHKEFAWMIGEAACERGARVSYRLIETAENEQFIRHATLEQLENRYLQERLWYARLQSRGAAVVFLDDGVVPRSFLDLARSHPVNFKAFTRSLGRAHIAFFDQALTQRKSPMLVAPAPTSRWAEKLFPQAEPAQALDLLWQILGVCTYAANRSPLQHLARQEAEQQRRMEALNRLEILVLHVESQYCDFEVTLSPRARWRGGPLTTQKGQKFHINFPCVEIFTVPDWRGTKGFLRSGQPLRLRDGTLVAGLLLRFEDGLVVEASASVGERELLALLESQPGARALGEIALVGQESALASRPLRFEQLNLDENAGSHVALGQGLTPCLADGATLSADQLDEIGFNRSPVHQDVIFGDETTTVTATTAEGRHVEILEGGRFYRKLG